MRSAGRPTNLFPETLSGLLILYVCRLKILRTVARKEAA
jgi:hypothetical protein